MQRLAIIGAGMAGLGAAWALRNADLDVTLFEKSRGVSGRAATRGRQGVRYDHGANYVKTPTPRLRQLLLDVLPTDDLLDIGRPVWTFAADGATEPGDPAQNAEPKWTYRDGISTLGKLIHAQVPARLVTQVRMTHVERRADGWQLTDTEGRTHGPFEAVLVTAPAPQAADLFAEADTSWATPVEAALRAASYRSQLTFVLGYEQAVPRPGAAYAFVNTDGGHDVAWLSFEADKPGHVPDGQEVLIAQMAPGWSTAHYERDPETLLPQVIERVAHVLGTDLGPPAWFDRQRWRYALPERPADRDRLAPVEKDGLFFAGDGIAGEGRVHAALADGLDVAPRIARHLGLRAL